jgi:L-ascorbate metabolism protein UlaG (beta-lactamase superfamily)
MRLGLGPQTEMIWLGHAAFLFRSPAGSIMIDPWLRENPLCPVEFRSPQELGGILITHGHAHHLGDVIDLAARTGAAVVANSEIADWLQSKGVKNLIRRNIGGSVDELGGFRLTMTHAWHSSTITDGEQTLPGGSACGYVIELPGGRRVYHAGDTALFSDMKLIADFWRPEIAIFPIGRGFTMGPKQAAAAAVLTGIKTVIPMHWGTDAELTGTPAELRRELEEIGATDVHVVDAMPGLPIQ